MTLLDLVVVWFILSPVLALVCGALVRAGRGPSRHDTHGTLGAPLDEAHGRDDLPKAA